MKEITYLPQIECNITVENGIADTHVIHVPDEENKRHCLRVGKGNVVRDGDKTYLPVGIVHLDYRGQRAQIELPMEADSGAHRIWVPFPRFRPLKEAS